MRLVDRFARPAVDDSQRFAGRGLEPSGAAIFSSSYGSPDREQILPTLTSLTRDAYGANPIVFGAILARLSLFSEAEFKWRGLTDKRLWGSPALMPLEYPWPNGTTGELLARMIQDVDLAGNAYIWNTGERLVRLRPDWITIVSVITGAPAGGYYREVIGYWFEPPSSDLQFPEPFALGVDEVAHWSPVPDPCATFRGMSWMTPVIREIEADVAMTGYKETYLRRGARPSVVVKYAQKINKTAVQRIAEQVEARHGGVENSSGVLVLDEGADPVVLGNSFEEMSFATVQAAGENRILIASGVPGIVVGAKEGLSAATYSNYAQAMRRFADITMRPLWRSACAALAKLVVVPAGNRLWFDTSDIAALRDGEKERADTALVRAEAIAQLIDKFEADSIVASLQSGDFSQLVERATPLSAIAAGSGAPAPGDTGAAAETQQQTGTGQVNGRSRPALTGATT